MPVPSVLLAGRYPHINTSAFLWTIGFGTNPFVGHIDLLPDDARNVLLLTGRQIITIKDGGREATIKGVYITGERPSPSPYVRRVGLADLRWVWQRNWILRRFNIRRRGQGRKLLNQDGEIADQIAPNINDIEFQPWSLKDDNGIGIQWKARECLLNILKELSPNQTPSGVFTKDQYALPVENMDIDSPGPNAVQQVLDLIPGIALFIDLEGRIRFQSSYPGDAVFSPNLVPLLQDGGHMGALVDGRFKKLDMSAARPTSVHVGFTREFEVRFDSKAEAAPRTTVAMDVEYARNMRNVLPTTDPITTVAGRKVSMGTWVNLDDIFTATVEGANAGDNWGKPDASTDQLSHELIQKLYMSPALDMMMVMGQQGRGVEANSRFARRVSAWRQHYRTTYRINQKWIDAALQIKAQRLVLLDQETGTMSPSIPFANYCVKPTRRGIKVQQDAGKLGWNVVSYPPGPEFKLIDGAPTPATIQMIDADQGIFHFSFRFDLENMSVQIIPSEVIGIPEHNAHSKLVLWAQAHLSSTHRVAVVLSMVPGGPNNDGNLRWIKISSDAAFKKLRRPAESSMGPVWQLRIRPTMQSAWYGWRDEPATANDTDWGTKVATAFGIGPVPKKPVDFGDALNEDRITELAEGEASALYSRLQDHFLGAMTLPFSPELEPRGEVQSVTHSFAPVGPNQVKAQTTVSATTPSPTLSAMNMLSPAVRRILLRQVEA